MSKMLSRQTTVLVLKHSHSHSWSYGNLQFKLLVHPSDRMSWNMGVEMCVHVFILFLIVHWHREGSSPSPLTYGPSLWLKVSVCELIFCQRWTKSPSFGSVHTLQICISVPDLVTSVYSVMWVSKAISTMLLNQRNQQDQVDQLVVNSCPF